MTISNAAAGSLSEERCWSGGRCVIKIAPTHHASAMGCHKANFEIEVAYQQSEIGGGDIRSWRLTLESAVDGVSKKVTQAGTLSCLLPPIAETTTISWQKRFESYCRTRYEKIR